MLLALPSVLNVLALLVGWYLLLVAFLRVVLGPDTTADLHSRLLAFIMDRFKAKQKEQLGPIKSKLFQKMSNMQSGNSKNKNGALDILEVGVGPGANLEFYPAGSSLTCVDTNPHFEQYFRHACTQQASHLSPDVHFVIGEGEHMTGVEDNSVDAVVVTLVLCSVRDAAKVVSEAHRVLRPGGNFFYLEHVADGESMVWRRIQNAITNCGLWPWMMQCWLNRDPCSLIAAAGFRSVDQSYQRAQPSLSRWHLLNLVNNILTGVATK